MLFVLNTLLSQFGIQLWRKVLSYETLTMKLSINSGFVPLAMADSVESEHREILKQALLGEMQLNLIFSNGGNVP